MVFPGYQPDDHVQSLKGLIGWFHQSSDELIQEYRRLEARADYLKRQLEAKHQELEISLRERLRSSLSIGSDAENAGLASRLGNPLMDVDLDIQVVVDVVLMKVGEIMGLRPSDIIHLNTPGMDQVELWVEGKRKFVGKGAQRNGNKVFIASRRYC